MQLKTFAERLHWARHNKAKITQTELRDRMEKEYGVDIGRNYISELEKDTGDEPEKRPAFYVVRAMAGVLGVSIDFFANFTDDPEPHAGDGEQAAIYFSEEADEVAKIVDGLRPEQRATLVLLARNLSAVGIERARQQAEAMDVLDSIERDLGSATRQEVERIFRDKGILKGD